MADVKFEVTRFALPTSGTTHDITISGFGTPKAALFIMSSGATDDVIKSDIYASFGFTDGTRQYCCAINSNEPLTTSVEERRQVDDAVIHTARATAKYSFNSWVTDGVRLNIDTAIGNSRLCTVVLIGGADVSNAYAGIKALGTGTAAVDITDPGFEPDLVFMSATGLGLTPNSAIHHILSVGVGINDGSDTQRMIATCGSDGQTTTKLNTYISNTKIVGQIFNDAVSWVGTIGSYDASGFSITPSVSAANDEVVYLALKFSNSPDIDLFDMSFATSGNYAETTPGFEPSFGMLFGSTQPTSRNSIIGGSGSMFISSFDSSSIYTESYTSVDNVTTSIAKSLSADRLHILDDDGSTSSVIASSYAFDSSGWDFTLTTNPAATVLGFGLAIGSGAPPAANDIPVFLQHFRNQGQV